MKVYVIRTFTEKSFECQKQKHQPQSNNCNLNIATSPNNIVYINFLPNEE